MSFKVIITGCLMMLIGTVMGQEKKSKADILFFEYAYNEAIAAYENERQNTPLTFGQQLNLADSYLKVGRYKNATETYLEVYKKDTTMSTHHFNKMLQSMAKTSGSERVKAFLATKKSDLTGELLENAEFNFALLESAKDIEDFKIFGINANSPKADFSATFYGDKLLYTSGRSEESERRKKGSSEGYLNIYIGKVGLGGQILNPNPFTGIPESRFHEATPFYSSELNSIFYIRSNATNGRMAFDENGKNALAIGLVSGSGSFQYLLKDLSTSFYYPFYDATDEKLYFAANFEEGYGGTDIYYVHTNNGLIMSAPVNLGPRINTPGNEIAPFIFENSLYFASDVFYGLGGMDIYKSEMGEEGFFSIPVNLGKGMNSRHDDFGFIVKNNIAEGYIGYFSSNRPGGLGDDDIYGFHAKEKPGLKTLVFRGDLRLAGTNQGISKALVRVFDKEDNLIKETYSKEDGSYRLEIQWREDAKLTVGKPGFSSFSEVYDEQGLEELQRNKTLDIELSALEDLVREREEKTVVKINKFFFDQGQYVVTPEIAAELDNIAETLFKFPMMQLRIEAHTDSRGGKTSNKRLSQRRAEAIKRYLLNKGVPAVNVPEAVGFGEEQIINNCRDGVYCIEVLHKQNERYHAVVLNYEELSKGQ